MIERALPFSTRRDDRLTLLAGLAALREESAMRAWSAAGAESARDAEPAEGTDSAGRSRGQRDLDAAVEALAEAVESAMPDHPFAGPLLINLALLRGRVFAVTGDLEELENTVRDARRAREVIGDDHPSRSDVLDSVVALLVEAEEFLGRPELLDEAVDAGRESIAAGGSGLRNLAMALRVRFECTGDLSDLLEAQRCAEQAIERSETAEMVAELGHILRLHQAVAGGRDLAERAVAAWRRSIELTPDGDDEECDRRAALAGALMDHHQAGDPTALAEALAQARSALAQARARGEPDLVTCQTAATVFHAWADQHQDAQVMREAESAARGALLAADQDEAYRAIALDTLATALHGGFLLTGEEGVLGESIEFGREAVTVRTTNPSDHAGHQGNLGSSLFDRYALTGDRADLEAAIELDRRAVARLDDAHPELAIYLNNLNIALRHRYELAGSGSDLEEAIEAGRAAVARSIDGPDRPLRCSNLGSSLFVRHDRFGELSDLDEDVDWQREAVRSLPPGHPDRLGLLNNLGIALQRRHQYLGTEGDLREAVAALREAVSAGPRPLDLPGLRSTYGLTLHALSESTGDREYLDQAVEQLRSAVAATGDEDPELPRRLGNLVTLLESASDESDDDDDADDAAANEAVDAGLRGLATLPDGHPDTHGLRSSLALALCARGRDGDQDEAVRMASTAVAEAPEDHPDRAQFLVNRAYVLRERHTGSGAERDLDEMINALREAASIGTAPPITRLRAAQAWGRAAAGRGDLADAALGLGRAVELMPEVSPRRLERSDAQRWLADLSGLAGAAAAMYLACQQPERAVGMLELGRGVLLNRVLRTRDDTTALRAADGPLADAFERLRDQLDLLGTDEPLPLPVRAGGITIPEDEHVRVVAGRQRERRRDLVREFADVVERVRRLTGFSGFLRPPAVKDLLAEAAEGPVVLVNVSEYRCDALLLTAAGLRHVPLPGLRADELDDLALTFHQQVGRAHDRSSGAPDRDRAEQRLADILDRLWTTVALPVLNEMDRAGCAVRPDSSLWWVPTGAFAFLPLHAAMARDGGDSVLDRAISLYTPTVTALRHARRRNASDTGRHPVVIISSRQDGRYGRLPSAAKEATRVAEGFGVEPLDAAHVPRSVLLSAIKGCSHLHVALHARSDPDNPSQSCLVLTGSELPVTEIVAMRNDRARLAYLSACETTLTTAALADEAIHLTSAFQLAGFPHVVGTLWEVQDLVAARAAARFYEALSRFEGDVARAAHETARYLRDRYRGHPSVWAAHHCAGA